MEGLIEPTHYEVLGVAADAEEAEIKKAWRDVAKICHPDRNAGDKSALARFKKAAAAWDTLSNPVKRSEYDNLLAIRHRSCESCGQLALPNQRLCYFCAMRAYQAEQDRRRAQQRAAKEAEARDRKVSADAQVKAAAEAVRKARAEREPVEKEYGWEGDPAHLDDLRTLDDYAYGGGSLDADELLSVLLSDAAIRSATRAARRSGIKSVSVTMRTKDGAAVDVVVNKDMVDYLKEVNRGLKSAERLVGLVGKWWKAKE